MMDEQIEEIRIARLVGMMAEIKAHQEALMKLRHAELEWQTQALAHFISATIEDAKGREQMSKAAGKLKIMPDEEIAPLPVRADTNNSNNGMTAEEELEYIMTHGDERALAKNEKNAGKSLF